MIFLCITHIRGGGGNHNFFLPSIFLKHSQFVPSSQLLHICSKQYKFLIITVSYHIFAMCPRHYWGRRDSFSPEARIMFTLILNCFVRHPKQQAGGEMVAAGVPASCYAELLYRELIDGLGLWALSLQGDPQKGFTLRQSPLPRFSRAVAVIVANGGTRTQTPGGWCSAQRGRASLHGSSCGTRCGETIKAQIRPWWSSVTER